MRASILSAAGVCLVFTALQPGLVIAQGTAAAPAANSAASQEQPSEMVEATAKAILKDLDANRDAYRKDPAKTGALVDKYLLPHFDTETSAKLVLGLAWRNATPDQRKRFIDAFYHSLIINYGSALTDFTADRLKVFPSKVDAAADRATVRTEIKRDNGDRVPINYVMRKTPQGWKAIDVQIEGISYVKSYHDDFGAQIDQQGLDAVISRLEKGEKPSDISKTVQKTSK